MIYQEYNQQDRIAQIQSEIAVIEALLAGDFDILPPEVLKVEELEQQKKLAALRKKQRNSKEQRLPWNMATSKAQRDYENLQRELTVIGPKIQSRSGTRKYQETVAQEARVLGEIRTQIHNHETALRFLEVLPRAAMGPLWVEVVRLALQQGEIDDLLQQAVERLSIRFPDDAATLMAEIAARSSNPFTIDISPPQADAVAQWLAAIAKARALKADNIGVAAQVLVEHGMVSSWR